MKQPDWPDERALLVVDINFRGLAARGIDCWIFDLDNTLQRKRRGGEPELDEVAIRYINELRNNGVISRVALCSNVIIPSQKRIERVRRAADRLQQTPFVVCCDFWHQKPSPWGFEPREHRAAPGRPVLLPPCIVDA